MQSRKLGAALAVAALAVAVALFVVLRDEDDDSGSTPVTTTTVGDGTQDGDGDAGKREKPKPKPAVPTVEVRNGRPVGGPAEISVSKGDRVELRVEAGGGGFVHVHGYDADRDLNPKGVAALSFPASTDGVYEVEYHAGDGSQVAVAEITVNP